MNALNRRQVEAGLRGLWPRGGVPTVSRAAAVEALFAPAAEADDRGDPIGDTPDEAAAAVQSEPVAQAA